MEHFINHSAAINANNAASYSEAAAQFKNEAEVPQELSCNQQIKNLLKTNLRLLKLNEINTILLF